MTIHKLDNVWASKSRFLASYHRSTFDSDHNNTRSYLTLQSKLPLIIAIDVVVTIGVLGAVFAWWKCDSCPTQAGQGVVQACYEPSLQFSTEFADAFRARDMSDGRLLCWDGVDSWTKRQWRSLSEDHSNELVDVVVIPTDPEQITEYELTAHDLSPTYRNGQLRVTYRHWGRFVWCSQNICWLKDDPTWSPLAAPAH